MQWLEDSMEGDMRPLLALAMQMQANAVAEQFNMGPGRMGEVFRLARFGDFEELFQAFAEPLPDAEEAPSREGLDLVPHAPPWTAEQMDQIFPQNVNQRLRLMGHHHLCAGAFEKLLQDPGFSAEFDELVSRLEPYPELEIESIYGYDLFCYQCSYWSEDGRTKSRRTLRCSNISACGRVKSQA
jgi:hypothetical protein